jgi:ribosome-associated heat shock protein Hsp15
MERAGSTDESKPVRIDKWLWAARFFKTRGLAQTAIETGHVLVGGDRVKVARNLKLGERLSIAIGDVERQVDVLGLSDVRRAAPIAQALYQETPESIAKREAQAQRRKLYREPAREIIGRPTKRDRRDLERAKDAGDA